MGKTYEFGIESDTELTEEEVQYALDFTYGDREFSVERVPTLEDIKATIAEWTKLGDAFAKQKEVGE